MDSLFEYRNCPNCGKDDFTVLLESNMKEDDFQEDIATVYMLPGDKYGRHVKCRNCQLIYVNPIEKAGKINQNYSERKNVDASIIQESRLHAAKSQVGLIKKYKNSTSLLDIGCGEGFFLSNASKTGYTTKGIELSQDAATYAKREFGLDIEVRHFEGSQFPENCFDVVTLWQVLEHLPYPLTTLKQVYRILKPGGLVIVSTPDIRSTTARIFRKRWWNITRLHINQFTTNTLKDILENAGFKSMSSVCYRESVSLLMLLIPVLRYLKVYKSPENSLYGKTMNKLIMPYPSKIISCTVLGSK